MPLCQIARELESEIHQLQHQVFPGCPIVCAGSLHGKGVDRYGRCVVAIPATSVARRVKGIFTAVFYSSAAI